MELSKRKIKHWGTAYEVCPELFETVYGDGKQLIYLSFIDMRPDYYLIWIDSSTDLGSDDNSWIDDIIEDLESFYGCYHGDGNIDEYEFPCVIDTGCGYSWGDINNEDGDYAEALALKETFQK